MKKIISLCTLFVFVGNVFAQKETFDLVTYTAPKNWVKDIEKNLATYTISNKENNSWCRIIIVKSTASMGSIEKDFENEWQELIVKNYKPEEKPQSNETIEADGWKIKAGGAKFIFNSSDAMALLTTATRYNRCVSIVTITNSQDYTNDVQAFLESIDLKNPEEDQQGNSQQNNTETNTQVSSSLTRYIWKAHQNRKDGMGGSAGYSTNSYQFYSNGTYKFSTITFQYFTPKYYTVEESGTYQINGNKITLTPQKSNYYVRQREKTDPVFKSGSISLETAQYNFEYTTVYDRLRLVLTPGNGNETKRDGGFNYYVNNEKTKSYLYDAEEEISIKPTTTPVTNNTALIGIWGKGNSAGQPGGSYGRWSYTKEQYIFNSNGTYSFAHKVYKEDDIETLLTRETGIFSVSGNKITLSPSANVIEAWSKSNGGDNFKQLRSQQKKPLEKTTYQFSVEYEHNLKQTSLLLTANATARDGTFNATINNNNGWRYGPTPPYKPVIMPN